MAKHLMMDILLLSPEIYFNFRILFSFYIFG